MIQLQQRTSESPPKKYTTLAPLKQQRQAVDFRYNLKQQALFEVRQSKKKQFNEFNSLQLQGSCRYYIKEIRRFKAKALSSSRNKYSFVSISKGEILPTIVDWRKELQNPEYLEDFTNYVKQQVIK